MPTGSGDRTTYSQCAVPLGFFGPCPLRLQLNIAGPGRPFGMPGLALLARNLSQFGLFDQTCLEQLLLKRIRFCHAAASYWGFLAIMPPSPPPLSSVLVKH